MKLIKTGEYHGRRFYTTPCGRVEVELCIKSHARKERDYWGRRVGGTITNRWYLRRGEAA